MDERDPDPEYRPGADYDCPVCGESVETMSDVYDHLRVHDVEPSDEDLSPSADDT